MQFLRIFHHEQSAQFQVIYLFNTSIQKVGFVFKFVGFALAYVWKFLMIYFFCGAWNWTWGPGYMSFEVNFKK